MGLRKTDLSKAFKFSLKEAKLPPPALRESIPTPQAQPSEEETTFSHFAAQNSLLETLVETLDLVSFRTGERIKKVTINTKAILPSLETMAAVAQQTIGENNSCSQKKIIEALQKYLQINEEIALLCFEILQQNKLIKTTQQTDLYHLTGSTPF